MKNKKILAILTISAIVSAAATGCSFGGDEPEEQVVVTETPAPEATATPTPEPTIAPDVQDSTYTSSNGAVSIKLPDATWSNKADEADMLSFESPEQGKILILHGQGEEDMSSAMLPDTQDLAVALEQASDLAEGTDFEIQDYTASDVEGVGVYSYTVKYTDASKSGGYVYAIHKIYKSSDEYYNICGSVVDEASYAGVKAAVDSFGIAGESSLKAAAPVQSSDSADGSTEGSTDGSTDGKHRVQVLILRPQVMEAVMEQSQTLADLPRNSLPIPTRPELFTATPMDIPLVITPDGNGNWVDFDGNTYRL